MIDENDRSVARHGIAATIETVSKSRKSNFLSLATGLAPLVVRDAPISRTAKTLSPDTVNAFKEAGLFSMLSPTEVNGGGSGLVEFIAVVEELARADGSAGWSMMANAGASAAAAAYLPDSAVNIIFDHREVPVLAGMFGPAGKARAVSGGYTVGGKFSFGSGMNHADWIGGGMLVIEDGAPRKLPNGVPEVQVCFFAKKHIEILGNWDVTGLIGTGSFDYVVPDQFISKDMTFERTTLSPCRGAPFFKLGLGAVAAAGHAAVALGLMKRALEEIAAIASEKKRPGYASVIADNDAFKFEFAQQESAYWAARGYVFNAFGEAEQKAAIGTDSLSEAGTRMRQATTWAHQIAANVVRFAHLWSGSEAIRNANAISRVSTDMAVATQHVYVDPITMIDAAVSTLKSWKRTARN